MRSEVKHSSVEGVGLEGLRCVPKGVWGRIVSYVGAREVGRLERVCKYFREIKVVEIWQREVFDGGVFELWRSGNMGLIERCKGRLPKRMGGCHRYYWGLMKEAEGLMLKFYGEGRWMGVCKEGWMDVYIEAGKNVILRGNYKAPDIPEYYRWLRLMGMLGFDVIDKAIVRRLVSMVDLERVSRGLAVDALLGGLEEDLRYGYGGWVRTLSTVMMLLKDGERAKVMEVCGRVMVDEGLSDGVRRRGFRIMVKFLGLESREGWEALCQRLDMDKLGYIGGGMKGSWVEMQVGFWVRGSLLGLFPFYEWFCSNAESLFMGKDVKVSRMVLEGLMRVAVALHADERPHFHSCLDRLQGLNKKVMELEELKWKEMDEAGELDVYRKHGKCMRKGFLDGVVGEEAVWLRGLRGLRGMVGEWMVEFLKNDVDRHSLRRTMGHLFRNVIKGLDGMNANMLYRKVVELLRVVECREIGEYLCEINVRLLLDGRLRGKERVAALEYVRGELRQGGWRVPWKNYTRVRLAVMVGGKEMESVYNRMRRGRVSWDELYGFFGSRDEVFRKRVINDFFEHLKGNRTVLAQDLLIDSIDARVFPAFLGGIKSLFEGRKLGDNTVGSCLSLLRKFAMRIVEANNSIEKREFYWQYEDVKTGRVQGLPSVRIREGGELRVIGERELGGGVDEEVFVTHQRMRSGGMNETYVEILDQEEWRRMKKELEGVYGVVLRSKHISRGKVLRRDIGWLTVYEIDVWGLLKDEEWVLRWCLGEDEPSWTYCLLKARWRGVWCRGVRKDIIGFLRKFDTERTLSLLSLGLREGGRVWKDVQAMMEWKLLWLLRGEWYIQTFELLKSILNYEDKRKDAWIMSFIGRNALVRDRFENSLSLLEYETLARLLRVEGLDAGLHRKLRDVYWSCGATKGDREILRKIVREVGGGGEVRAWERILAYWLLGESERRDVDEIRGEILEEMLEVLKREDLDLGLRRRFEGGILYVVRDKKGRAFRERLEPFFVELMSREGWVKERYEFNEKEFYLAGALGWRDEVFDAVVRESMRVGRGQGNKSVQCFKEALGVRMVARVGMRHDLVISLLANLVFRPENLAEWMNDLLKKMEGVSYYLREDVGRMIRILFEEDVARYSGLRAAFVEAAIEDLGEAEQYFGRSWSKEKKKWVMGMMMEALDLKRWLVDVAIVQEGFSALGELVDSSEEESVRRFFDWGMGLLLAEEVFSWEDSWRCDLVQALRSCVASVCMSGGGWKDGLLAEYAGRVKEGVLRDRSDPSMMEFFQCMRGWIAPEEHEAMIVEMSRGLVEDMRVGIDEAMKVCFNIEKLLKWDSRGVLSEQSHRYVLKCLLILLKGGDAGVKEDEGWKYNQSLVLESCMSLYEGYLGYGEDGFFVEELKRGLVEGWYCGEVNGMVFEYLAKLSVDHCIDVVGDDRVFGEVRRIGVGVLLKDFERLGERERLLWELCRKYECLDDEVFFKFLRKGRSLEVLREIERLYDGWSGGEKERLFEKFYNGVSVRLSGTGEIEFNEDQKILTGLLVRGVLEAVRMDILMPVVWGKLPKVWVLSAVKKWAEERMEGEVDEKELLKCVRAIEYVEGKMGVSVTGYEGLDGVAHKLYGHIVRGFGGEAVLAFARVWCRNYVGMSREVEKRKAVVRALYGLFASDAYNGPLSGSLRLEILEETDFFKDALVWEPCWLTEKFDGRWLGMGIYANEGCRRNLVKAVVEGNEVCREHMVGMLARSYYNASGWIELERDLRALVDGLFGLRDPAGDERMEVLLSRINIEVMPFVAHVFAALTLVEGGVEMQERLVDILVAVGQKDGGRVRQCVDLLRYYVDECGGDAKGVLAKVDPMLSERYACDPPVQWAIFGIAEYLLGKGDKDADEQLEELFRRKGRWLSRSVSGGGRRSAYTAYIEKAFNRIEEGDISVARLVSCFVHKGADLVVMDGLMNASLRWMHEGEIGDRVEWMRLLYKVWMKKGSQLSEEGGRRLMKSMNRAIEDVRAMKEVGFRNALRDLGVLFEFFRCDGYSRVALGYRNGDLKDLVVGAISEFEEQPSLLNVDLLVVLLEYGGVNRPVVGSGSEPIVLDYNFVRACLRHHLEAGVVEGDLGKFKAVMRGVSAYIEGRVLDGFYLRMLVDVLKDERLTKEMYARVCHLLFDLSMGKSSYGLRGVISDNFQQLMGVLRVFLEAIMKSRDEGLVSGLCAGVRQMICDEGVGAGVYREMIVALLLLKDHGGEARDKWLCLKRIMDVEEEESCLLFNEEMELDEGKVYQRLVAMGDVLSRKLILGSPAEVSQFLDGVRGYYSLRGEVVPDSVYMGGMACAIQAKSVEMVNDVLFLMYKEGRAVRACVEILSNGEELWPLMEKAVDEENEDRELAWRRVGDKLWEMRFDSGNSNV